MENSVKCFNSIRFFMGVLFVFCSSLAMSQDFDTDTPIGWAVVPGNGVISTTGGGNGRVVTATTGEELINYAKSSEELIILVEGTIKKGGTMKIASNKTIIGKGSGANIIGLEFNMSSVSNIIIRNLTISNARDAFALRRTHHVWIDHCDVSDCGDGLIDITNESDFNTVSWTRLSVHDKTNLVNSGTGKPEDMGTLNTTLHHLWYDGTVQRNPRVGYGKVHVFNCQYTDNPSYGIGVHSQGRVLAERNYFDGVNSPIHQMYRMDPYDINHGFCEELDNIFDNCVGDRHEEGISFPVDDFYMYDFILDEAADVPAIVKINAGPGEQYEKLGLMPIPGNGAVSVGADPKLSWTKGQTATSYVVSFGATYPPTEVSTTSEQYYNPGPLTEGTVYYWSVDQVTPDSTIKGKVWKFRTEGTVVGRPNISIVSPVDGDVFPISSEITIVAEASDDNGAVAKVEFFEGNTLLVVDTIAPYSVEWDVVEKGEHYIKAKVTDDEGNWFQTEMMTITAVSPGPEGYEFCSAEGETCTADGTVNVAYGSDGKFNYIYNVTGSIDCNTSVFGNPAYGVTKACYTQASTTPYGVITSPEPKSSFTAPANISISADASDGDGTVASVEFFNGETSLGIVNTYPYTISWDDVAAGEYSITIQVTDDDGKVFTSEGVKVIVQNETSSFDVNDKVMSLYPNPVSDELTITLNSEFSDNTFVTICNIQGEVIVTEKIIKSKQILNLNNLPEGLYFVNLYRKNKEIISKKIIKEGSK